MDEIKGIRIVSLTGEKEYGIEDSEVREELANVVDGAPEELDSFKEAFEKFKEGGEVLAGIAADVAAVGKAVADETTRAEKAEKALDDKITAEADRAEEAESKLDSKITTEADRAKEAENELANAITEEAKATDEKIAKEKTRAEAVEQTLANDIAKAPNLALRALFIAAGAEYNDSGVDKTKTAPWGETVTHKAGHYYLNGLGDITEEQMSEIYTSDKFWISKDARGFLSGYKVRTNITAKAAELFRSYAYDFANSVYECPNLEVLVLCNPASTSDTYRTITISRFSESLYSVRKLKRIFGILNLRSTTTTNLHATVLEHINILGLMCNLNISKTGVISKESVLYMIQKAAPTSAITITLHADAYARLANNADIVAALEAQPLITLVSA